jgi:SpoVK/Ycf46/Vps4 family AAA+-type ATPase
MAGLDPHLATTAALFLAATAGTWVGLSYDMDAMVFLGALVAATAGFLTTLNVWFLGVGFAGSLVWVGVFMLTAEADSGPDTDADTAKNAPSDDTPQFVETDQDLDFEDVGGMTDLKRTLRERVIKPLENPDRYERYDLGIINGVLLYGPPGCGKTHVANALAGELGFELLSATPTDITSKWVGEAAANVADLFETARKRQPCIVFLDELDAIATDRSDMSTTSQQQMLNQLLVELQAVEDQDIVVVAATNYIDDIDGAILRSGRFDERIEVPAPGPIARRAVLEIHLEGRPTVDSLSLDPTVAATTGYASSDVELVADLAARHAMADDDPISEAHLAAAVEETATSIPEWFDRYEQREAGEGAAVSVKQPDGVNIPAAAVVDTGIDQRLSGLPGLSEQKTAIRERLLDAVEHADRYAAAGVDGVDGILLYGPPECGARDLSRAAAGELDRPLVRLTPDLLVRWESDPGTVLADIVSIARANQPCVLLIEELHTLAPPHRDQRAGITLADQLEGLLRELADDNVLVFATGQSTDAVDAGVLASGCFDERLEVPHPDAETQRAVLREGLTEELIALNFDWERAADIIDDLTLAEIRQVAAIAVRRGLRRDDDVTTEDIASAAAAVTAEQSGRGTENVRYIE